MFITTSKGRVNVARVAGACGGARGASLWDAKGKELGWIADPSELDPEAAARGETAIAVQIHWLEFRLVGHGTVPILSHRAGQPLILRPPHPATFLFPRPDGRLRSPWLGRSFGDLDGALAAIRAELERRAPPDIEEFRRRQAARRAAAP
jgi:hypothetical protein